jgi:hypothetical protein
MHYRPSVVCVTFAYCCRRQNGDGRAQDACAGEAFNLLVDRHKCPNCLRKPVHGASNAVYWVAMTSYHYETLGASCAVFKTWGSR